MYLFELRISISKRFSLGINLRSNCNNIENFILFDLMINNFWFVDH
jgi:hypothetical protein